MATPTSPAAQPRVFFDPTRKRFQAPSSDPLPSLLLDGSGMIQGLSAEARRLLEYAPSDAVEPCFFSHVHGRNQRQVMRDVADMILHGKRVATWFLRMRTGRRRWQWYRAQVFNDLDSTGAIQVRLSEATPAL